MARFKATILCDFAQVRDGLLFVSSGGITRIATASLPAHPRLYLAVIAELIPDELNIAHELRVRVQANASATVVARGVLAFGPHPSLLLGTQPGEAIQCPIVMDIQADLPEFGSYDIDLTLDDKPEMPLTFRVVPTPS